MMLVQGLLLSLILTWIYAAPEPGVDVKVNVNVGDGSASGGSVGGPKPEIDEDQECGNPTPLCTLAGGNCIDISDECDGFKEEYGCKGKHCTCCVPFPMDECPGSTCPDGFFRTSGSIQCYKLFNNPFQYLNGSQAKEKCEDEGMQLAEPLNPVEVRSYLVKVLGNERWVYLGAKGDGTSYVWDSNGKPISNTSPYWAPGQPQYVGACLQLMSHSPQMAEHPEQPYYAGPCSWQQNTLCEKISCPNGFFRTAGTNQCYKLFDDQYRNASEAREKCEKEGLRLAEPCNPVQVRSYIVKVLGVDTNNWVYLGAGGTDPKPEYLPPIYAWYSNGKHISNTSPYWFPGQPQHSNQERCLQLMTSSYRLKSNPDTPYHSVPCSNIGYTLCETKE